MNLNGRPNDLVTQFILSHDTFRRFILLCESLRLRVFALRSFLTINKRRP